MRRPEKRQWVCLCVKESEIYRYNNRGRKRFVEKKISSKCAAEKFCIFGLARCQPSRRAGDGMHLFLHIILRLSRRLTVKRLANAFIVVVVVVVN